MAKFITNLLKGTIFERKPKALFNTHTEKLQFIGKVKTMQKQKVAHAVRSIKPDHTNLATK